MKVIMLMMIGYSFLSFGFKSKNREIIGKYYGLGQICTITYSIDKKWELSINENYQFEYNKSSFDSRTNKTITNKITGKWSITNDSLLVLKDIIKLTDDFCPLDSIVYRINRDCLLTTFNCFDYFTEANSYLSSLDKISSLKNSKFIVKTTN